jgi:GNAT superfamily N-acetyltransferase
MKIQREYFERIMNEMRPLNEKHYHEVAMYTDKIYLSPNYEEYLKLEDLGMIACYTARTDCGELVGYSIFFVKAHIHYMHDVFACNDVIYIDPEYRGTSLAQDLMEYSLVSLANNGVNVVTMHMKSLKPFASLMERCGFEEAETVWTKYIGGN